MDRENEMKRKREPGQIKGVLVDIDRTLTDKERRVPEATAVQLERLRQAGVPIGVATGRHYAIIKNYILPFFGPDSWHVTAGGGQMVNEKGEVWWERLMDESAVEELKREVVKRGGGVVYGSGSVLYSTGDYIDNLRTLPWKFELQPMERAGTGPAALMMIVNLNQEIKKYVEERDDVTAKLLLGNSGKEYYDVTAKGVTKAEAARVWATKMNLTMEEVAAAGDSGNDRELLEAVGWAVAMGNATAEIKEVADEVIGGYEEAGLATFLATI